MSTALALPTTSNEQSWDDETRALMASAGLVHRDYTGKQTTAPRSVVASFLHQCARTGLDPLARQIYLIARKNQGELVWTTQISIDGFRLIAERSGHYAGQGDVEWLTDDGRWVDVWLPQYGKHPTAARATIYRDDFKAPLRAIALWSSYAQTKSNGDLTSMWDKHGPGQIAKCAEALGLRKAFPQDLSGLYTPDEMQQAETGTDGVPAVTKVQAPVFDPAPWEDRIAYAGTSGDLHKIWLQAGTLLDEHLSDGQSMRDTILAKKARLEQDAAAETPAADPEREQDYNEAELV